MSSQELLRLIKRASTEAVETSKPMNIVFGTVTSISPLNINIEQKLNLSEKFLILTQNVTDFEVSLTMDHTTENHTHTHTITDTYTNGGSASEETHNHSYKGTKTFLIHNGLKVGDKVMLLRMQGGQKYIVLDKVVSA